MTVSGHTHPASVGVRNQRLPVATDQGMKAVVCAQEDKGRPQVFPIPMGARRAAAGLGRSRCASAPTGAGTALHGRVLIHFGLLHQAAAVVGGMDRSGGLVATVSFFGMQVPRRCSRPCCKNRVRRR